MLDNVHHTGKSGTGRQFGRPFPYNIDHLASRHHVEEKASMPVSKPTRSRAILHPIGIIRSTLKNRSGAPRQGSEGAPDAWVEINAPVAHALDGLKAGDEIIV